MIRSALWALVGVIIIIVTFALTPVALAVGVVLAAVVAFMTCWACLIALVVAVLHKAEEKRRIRK